MDLVFGGRSFDIDHVYHNVVSVSTIVDRYTVALIELPAGVSFQEHECFV